MEDYCKLKVGAHFTGIMGLKAVLAEMVEQYSREPDERIGVLMREKLAAMNYIAGEAEQIYEQAFLREYRKFVGRPDLEEPTGELTVKVLGLGCPQCERLSREIMQVLAENNLAADLEHVTDPMEIAGYGVFATPVLIINGKVRSTGSVPPKAKMKDWLTGDAQ
jgi:hypothetical protein